MDSDQMNLFEVPASDCGWMIGTFKREFRRLEVHGTMNYSKDFQKKIDRLAGRLKPTFVAVLPDCYVEIKREKAIQYMMEGKNFEAVRVDGDVVIYCFAD